MAKNISSKDIKDILINTIYKTAEKSTQTAEYDKTILATIQYCSDATIGQYKIKYQNGYYTAYSKDTDTIYANQAQVYVLVPGNNMNNRMFITGAATNDSKQKIYISSLEGDQQYYADGSNYVLGLNGNSDINMSSYWAAGPDKEYRRVLWSSSSNQSHALRVNPSVNEFLKNASAIRIGAEFKTNLKDSRKTSGDYGLIFTFKYINSKKETHYKYFVIDTFHMIGSPFNFTCFMPQYLYWDLTLDEQVNDFIGLDKIEEYVVNFPVSDGSPVVPDIYIQNISLHKAERLYDNGNDKYRVAIISEDDFTFKYDENNGTIQDTLKLTAELRVNGNAVSSLQNVEYYWAKEDGSVNYVNHPKYNSYTGKGWYCLNSGVKKQYTGDDLDELTSYTVLQNDTSTPNEYIQWDTDLKNINLKSSLCPGTITRIKCVVMYDNILISSEIKEVIRKDGYYVLIKSENDKTVSSNGLGNFTINAGVFKDAGGALPESHWNDENITYQWTEIDETGLEKNLPTTTPNEILLSEPAWSSEEDNENKTDEAVAAYLELHPSYRRCIERYNYYNDKIPYYEGNTDKETEYNRCVNRKDNVITSALGFIQSRYSPNYKNTQFYIFGPSTVTGQYLRDDLQDYRSASINNAIHIYYNTTGYIDKQNTLYNLPASKIGNRATYKVTALQTVQGLTQAIGTETITLVNAEGNLSDYTLEIINGQIGFVYDEGGLAPNILIRPLFFKLYNKEGDVLYDSQNPSSSTSTNLTALHPKWQFYDTGNSLINTRYKDSDNCSYIADSPGMLQLENSNDFIYTLAKEYDVNKKESSNITLTVTIDGSTVIGSTNFTFTKEGELGTNGTNMLLDIDDNAYNNYKDNILTNPQYSTFKEKINGIDADVYYLPPQRHLNNTYLYATQCYDSAGNTANRLTDATYVNLKFAQNGTEDGVQGSNQITLDGYWYQDGITIPLNSGSKWSTLLPKGTYHDDSYYLKPSFTVSSSNGIRAIASVTYSGSTSSEDYAYKPTKLRNITIDGVQYDYKIANNIIRLESSETIDSTANLKRTNYGYYTIPYFYFHCPGMGEDFDPARHFVITGGFDQVLYDSAGLNPVYNKQEPFKFYMFDENGNDITEEVAAGCGTGKTYIEWDCSPGFRIANQLNINSFKNYSDISNTTELYKTYCKYNNKYYKCIEPHTKSQTIKIKDAKGNVIKTYNPGQFVTPYWQEVNPYREIKQSFNIIPASKYDTLVQQDLFNSWVSVYVFYNKGQNKTYEAEALIPINVLCNKYGSDELNNWDGKASIVNDAYMVSSKVAAGVKNDDNTFTGITLGSNFYPDNTERKAEIGLFGYGKLNKDDPNSWTRTLFIDANSGRAMFGPVGASQIVLDPKIPTGQNQVWSRIGGWYFSPDYLYKPIGDAVVDVSTPDKRNNYFTELAQGATIAPKNNPDGSVGMYCPWNKSVDSDTVWLWAGNNKITYHNPKNAKYYVTYGGEVFAQAGHFQGEIIAESGSFGRKDGYKININTDIDGKKYILYNKNFWVRDMSGVSDDEPGVCVKGRIMAKSGQFGKIGDNIDGNATGTVFIEYHWYPWRLPADDEEWNNDTYKLDTAKGMNQTYALYHKNFYITNSGQATFNGKIFTKAGRIGNWVINRNYLKSVNGNMRLAPDKLTIGEFSADQYGNLRGQNWFILADGTASFTNTGNTFVGSSFSTPGGSTLDEHGLNLAVGEQMGIGNTYLAAGENGFILHGGIAITDPSTFSSTVTFNDSAYFGGSSGAVTINNTGVNFGGPSGRYKIYTSGNAELNAVNVQSLTINNTSLQDYIRSYVGSSEIMNIIASKLSAAFSYKNQDWNQVKGTSQSVNIGYFPG